MFEVFFFFWLSRGIYAEYFSVSYFIFHVCKGFRNRIFKKMSTSDEIRDIA